MPLNYEKTLIKELEKKIKKSIASLEKQLKDLMFEKAHIQSCLDYFETDQEDFMQTVETYHTPSTPASSPPSLPRYHSPMSPQILPRPSFLQSMASSVLSVIPPDNMWLCSDCSYCTHRMDYHSYNTGGRTDPNNDPPLSESFSMFCHRTPSPPSYPKPPPESPQGPRKNQGTLTTKLRDTNVYVMTVCMAVVVHCCTLLLLFY